MFSALLFLFPLNAHHADERPFMVVDLLYSQPQLQTIGNRQLPMRRTTEINESTGWLSVLPALSASRLSGVCPFP
jgi:hypothetical protein